MKRDQFDQYIRRFNAEDPTAFDDFIAPDMKMLNGALEFTGIAGMRDHYENKIWPFFKEELNVLRFVSDEKHIGIQMWTHFTARVDGDTLFGPVRKGDTYDYRGLIMYDINESGRFSSIIVSYNSFVNTKVSGEVIEMGLPH
ncbi:nuclear transport factor 2 family protein [Rhizobium alvei]|uniref:Nuclear transport factor 2 family protein n=1 Tax=Rhizobium alvei TaxID=1132659 RepID=A0ABT8YLF3_9HYPH|nr:nuclear transport factor 2 family protein [Rhizobium alvei]MDO6964473.1 nuclear transport factor 2 family protein [Rhizobium alvei]